MTGLSGYRLATLHTPIPTEVLFCELYPYRPLVYEQSQFLKLLNLST